MAGAGSEERLHVLPRYRQEDVGPAFKEVAKKYAGDAGAAARLSAKVKTGGKGVWGEVPMPPNPQVKPEDVQKIVGWVLTLK